MTKGIRMALLVAPFLSLGFLPSASNANDSSAANPTTTTVAVSPMRTIGLWCTDCFMVQYEAFPYVGDWSVDVFLGTGACTFDVGVNCSSCSYLENEHDIFPYECGDAREVNYDFLTATEADDIGDYGCGVCLDRPGDPYPAADLTQLTDLIENQDFAGIAEMIEASGDRLFFNEERSAIQEKDCNRMGIAVHIPLEGATASKLSQYLEERSSHPMGTTLGVVFVTAMLGIASVRRSMF